MSKNLDVQGILTEARSDIECIVMAARQLPPEEGGPIAAAADAVGKKIERFVSWGPKSRQATAPRRIGVLRIRLRYLTWKLRALCWVLRRLRAGL